MSLSSRLKQLIGVYGQSDPGWVQFVYDHRDHILVNSSTITLSQEDANTYKYRPESYFYKTNTDTSKVWITLWLNQLTNICSFKGVSLLYVPSDDLLLSLKQRYDNYKSTISNL